MMRTIPRWVFASLFCALAALSACVTPASPPPTSAALEEIYVLRSVREREAPDYSCEASRTGFEPYPTNAARFFSFWSVQSGPDGRVVDAHRARVAELRGCFGPTSELPRQNFHAEIMLGQLSFHGSGE